MDDERPDRLTFLDVLVDPGAEVLGFRRIRRMDEDRCSRFLTQLLGSTDVVAVRQHDAGEASLREVLEHLVGHLGRIDANVPVGEVHEVAVEVVAVVRGAPRPAEDVGKDLVHRQSSNTTAPLDATLTTLSAAPGPPD